MECYRCEQINQLETNKSRVSNLLTVLIRSVYKPETTWYIFPMLFPINISSWNWFNTMIMFSALWLLMPWCFSTRASVTTVLGMCPCISSCLLVNGYIWYWCCCIVWYNSWHFTLVMMESVWWLMRDFFCFVSDHLQSWWWNWPVRTNQARY